MPPPTATQKRSCARPPRSGNSCATSPEAKQGQVAVGASDAVGSYLLPRLIVSFKQRHPRVGISLATASTAQVSADTLGGLNDFGIVETGPGIPDGLAVEPLFEQDLLIVAPPTHRLVGQATDPSRLAGEAIVARSASNQARSQFEWQLRELRRRTATARA